ncbi:MAG: nucleotidyltransferase domain-containing protein [Firmicutes bacterium]|nr:nucleotidyltransferase domain-containing protein [Bacillota bacterium]
MESSIVGLTHLTDREKAALADLVEELSASLGQRLQKVVLYGSKARGDFNADSDLDVLVVLDKRSLDSLDKVSGCSSDVVIEYGLPLAVVSVDAARLEQPSLFIRNVQRDGVELWTRH